MNDATSIHQAILGIHQALLENFNARIKDLEKDVINLIDQIAELRKTVNRKQ